MTIGSLTALAAAFSGAAALVTLLPALARRPVFALRDLVAPVAVLLVASLLGLVVLALSGLRLFGAVRYAFFLGAAVAPALGAVVLLGALRGRGRGRRVTKAAVAAGVLALLPGAAGAWAQFVEPTRLVLERTTVDLAPGRVGRDAVRIGVLSDLQAEEVGDHERRAVDLLLSGKPDLILVPGDLFQAPETVFRAELPALRELTGRLRAPAGAFFVRGDVDRPDQTRRALRNGPVRILENEVAVVRVGDRRIAVGGAAGARAADEPFLRSFATRPDPGEIRILVVHRPDAVLRLPPEGRIDLVVAGHTHGGQVRFPGLGPPVTLSRVPRSVAAGGLSLLRGYPLYVSRGIGVERGQAPRIRFFCPPEVSLITLR